MNTHIRVNSCVGTVGAGRCSNASAVNNQPAIGINTITLAGGSGDHDGKSAAIYSILYNGSYMLPNTILTVVLILLMQKPLRRFLEG